jgi:hypothetical protein
MMQLNTCFHHVFVIAGLVRPLDQGSGKHLIKYNFLWIELTLLNNIGRLNINHGITDDLLHSSIAMTLYQ